MLNDNYKMNRRLVFGSWFTLCLDGKDRFFFFSQTKYNNKTLKILTAKAM